MASASQGGLPIATSLTGTGRGDSTIPPPFVTTSPGWEVPVLPTWQAVGLPPRPLFLPDRPVWPARTLRGELPIRKSLHCSLRVAMDNGCPGKSPRARIGSFQPSDKGVDTMRRIVISLVVLAAAWMVIADTAWALGGRRARRRCNVVTNSQPSDVGQPTKAPASCADRSGPGARHDPRLPLRRPRRSVTKGCPGAAAGMTETWGGNPTAASPLVIATCGHARRISSVCYFAMSLSSFSARTLTLL